MEWWEGRSLPFTWSQQESSLLSMMLVVSIFYQVEGVSFYSWFTDIYIMNGCCILQMLFLQLLISSVQSLSHVQLFVTPWTATCQATLSITNSRSLPKLMFIKSVMQSNHLILCSPLLPCPQSFQASVFSNESALCMRWPKYWSFSFSISPSNEHPGLSSFRMDRLDLI